MKKYFLSTVMILVQMIVLQGTVLGWNPGTGISKKLFFKELMGKHEAKWVEDHVVGKTRAEVQQRIKKDLQKHGFGPGTFKRLSLRDLRANKNRPFNGVAKFEIIYSKNADETVAQEALQADPKNKNACFMIASRLHALEKNANQRWWNGEGNGPSLDIIRQESLITKGQFAVPDIFLGDTKLREAKTFGNYPSLLEAFYVGSQGEIAAFSATPAAIWRMYGEEPFSMIKEIGLKLSPTGMCEYKHNKRKINEIIKDLEAGKVDQYVGKMLIGVHTNVDVAYGYNETVEPNREHYHTTMIAPGQKIMQVFVSAINIKNLDGLDEKKKELFAKLFLRAGIEGTLRAAVAEGKKKVFLTMLGAGAFVNDPEWVVDILESMKNIILSNNLHVVMNYYIGNTKSNAYKRLMKLGQAINGSNIDAISDDSDSDSDSSDSESESEDEEVLQSTRKNTTIPQRNHKIDSESDDVVYSIDGRKYIISFVIGDITEKNDDMYPPRDVAIVNAANKTLILKGGVSGAIFNAAGDKVLTQSCKDYLRTIKKGEELEAGDVVLMPGCRLKNTVARKIVFAIGPDCRLKEEKKDKETCLKDAYKNSLHVASDAGIKEIRFPAISTNIFGYPIEKATPVAISACLKYLKKNPKTTIKRICFVVFADKHAKENRNIYINAWNDIVA